MPRLDKRELLERVASAINESGWNVLFIQTEHPFRLHIYDDRGNSYRIRIYIWNVTHGGGVARPSNEFRIQVTGVSQFEAETDGATLILGWYDELGVFAGFDFRRHQDVLGVSPSFQIREEYLRNAYVYRFAVCPKENEELALAFRPDFFVEYVSNLNQLHSFGEAPRDLGVLTEIASNPDAVNEEVIESISESRRETVISVRRSLRDAGFRDRVLNAYNHHCSFCGLQLDLVVAAHIIPVSEDGPDHTSNGVSACYLHHEAYDRGLITFDDQYRVLVKEEKMDKFIEMRRDDGMDTFRSFLRPIIVLPPDLGDRPNASYVSTANSLRGWN